MSNQELNIHCSGTTFLSWQAVCTLPYAEKCSSADSIRDAQIISFMLPGNSSYLILELYEKFSYLLITQYLRIYLHLG